MKCLVKDCKEKAIDDTPYCHDHQPVQGSILQYQKDQSISVPIIVSGGNSISVELPHQFSDSGATADAKLYTSGDVLLEIVIDGGTPIPLTRNSRIVIRYK